MHSLSPLFLLSLPVAFFPTRSHQLHTHSQDARSINSYALTDMYEGQSFLDNWNFFSDPDPTHGYVQYLDREDAISKRLAYVQSDGTTVLTVDNQSMLPPGTNRDSVRISSNKQYNGGLFIADFSAMPYGCAVWPAWWSYGPGWPVGGEVDVIEGVNNQITNQYAFHSGPNCYVDPSVSSRSPPAYTAQLGNPNCTSIPSDDTGCTFRETDSRSYGAGFNSIGGGVYAHLWDQSGIKLWHFARSEIPADITSKMPNPANWPTPAAFLPSSACDMASHFYDHVLTLDMTFCGDWAGPTYSPMGCPGSCLDYVADANNFANAKWIINYIAVYTVPSN